VFVTFAMMQAASNGSLSWFPMCFLIFPIIFIVTVVIIILWFQRWVESSLVALCDIDGYTYCGRNVPYVNYIMGQTKIGRAGGGTARYGIRWNYHGYDITVFEWIPAGDNQNQSQGFIFTVAIMAIDFQEPGSLYFRRERFEDKVSAFFGYNDLDFENQEFSDKYYVKANPDKFGYDFFNPRMIEFFLRSNMWLDMEVHTPYVVLYKAGCKTPWEIFSSLFKGRNPFKDWMRSAGYRMKHIHRNLPNYMLRSGNMPVQ